MPKKKVIFFDDEGFEIYKKYFDYILETNDYFVLKTREQNLDVVFISLKLILNLIFFY